MTELTRHGSAVPSVYTLLGTLENDLTAAVGHTLTRSPTLRANILKRVWPTTTAPTKRGLVTHQHSVSAAPTPQRRRPGVSQPQDQRDRLTGDETDEFDEIPL